MDSGRIGRALNKYLIKNSAYYTCIFVKFTLLLHHQTLQFCIMNQKQFLLPHFVQIIGEVLTLLGVVCFLFWRHEIGLFFGGMIFSIGLLLCAISREKIEDEYINYLRLKSIFRVAVVYLAYAVIFPALKYIAIHTLDLTTLGNIMAILGIFGQPWFLVLLHLAIFKGSIILTSHKGMIEG